MRRFGLPVFLGLGAFAVSLFAAAPARANCYALIGCSNKARYKASDLMQLGCQPLWEVRNWIYKENGYCFRTAEGDRSFRQFRLPLRRCHASPAQHIERYNMKTIKSVEVKKGC